MKPFMETLKDMDTVIFNLNELFRVYAEIFNEPKESKRKKIARRFLASKESRGEVT